MKTKKIDKILFVETLSAYYYPYQNWFLPLKKFCNQIISFDFRKNHLYHGKEKMNKMFLEMIRNEKPDFIFFWLLYDEFSLDTFVKIKQISPKTKMTVFFGDDDIQYENFSRYYALFFDYYFVAQPKYLIKYRKEGLLNGFPTLGVNTKIFKTLEVEKRFDVTFIGHPKTKQAGRYDYLKYLKENDVKLRIFGWGWENYPAIKDIYGGALDKNELVKVLNQSKITLAFTKNNYGEQHLIGKVFEAIACGTFVLIEYAEDYLDYFRERKEIVMFKNKEDLLEKINYYLKNDEKREKIAKASYERVTKDFSIEQDLKKFFERVEKDKRRFKHFNLPILNKKIVTISEKEILQENKRIIDKVKNFDYICFKKGKSKFLPYKEYLQAHSLLKSQKKMSCCDYYVFSKGLGDYVAFNSEAAFRYLSREVFYRFLDINELMVRKDYFLRNINLFKEAFERDKIDFLTNENTVFVTIPLVQVDSLMVLDYKIMKKAFVMRFLYDLYRMKNKGKIRLVSYLSSMLSEILKGRRFILNSILETAINKDKWTKLNKLKKEGKSENIRTY